MAYLRRHNPTGEGYLESALGRFADARYCVMDDMRHMLWHYEKREEAVAAQRCLTDVCFDRIVGTWSVEIVLHRASRSRA